MSEEMKDMNEMNEVAQNNEVETVETNEVAEAPAEVLAMSDKDMAKVIAFSKAMKIVAKIGVYLFLGLMAVIVLFPFYWMIISSLKSLEEYNLATPTLFPKEIIWSNYRRAFDTAHLGDLFVNTVYVGVVSTILSLVITFPASSSKT